MWISRLTNKWSINIIMD